MGKFGSTPVYGAQSQCATCAYSTIIETEGQNQFTFCRRLSPDRRITEKVVKCSTWERAEAPQIAGAGAWVFQQGMGEHGAFESPAENTFFCWGRFWRSRFLPEYQIRVWESVGDPVVRVLDFDGPPETRLVSDHLHVLRRKV